MHPRTTFFDYLNLVLTDLVNFRNNNSVKFQVLVRQILFTGYEAFSIVFLISLLLGGSLISFGNNFLGSIGQSSWVYSLIISVIIRDVGPVIVSYIILIRSGTAISTELGQMSYSGEISYIKSLGISPISYLVAPRVLGVLLSIFILMIYFAGIGIFGGYLVSSFIRPMPLKLFFEKLSQNLTFADLFLMQFKVLTSGFILSVLCTFHGLRVQKSRTEVPIRNIKAVTQSIVTILFFNGLLIGIFAIL